MDPFMRSLLLFALGTLSLASPAQDKSFSLTGETTDGRTVSLPQASAGKYCIIAVAASKKAEPLLQEWYEPAYLRFVAKQGLMVSDVDCDLWLVPVFTGLNKAAYGPSMERLKKEADPDIAQRVVFVKDDAAAMLDAMGIKDRDQPYFFVIGPDGSRKHTEKGAYDVDKLDALEEALSK
jgi:hypothetical protein